MITPTKTEINEVIDDIKKNINLELKSDKLDMMYEHQQDLQTKLGVYEKIISPIEKQQYINQMILALHEEAVEIMRETAYKNPDYVPFGWKKGQEFNNENFQDEIIDIIHFVLNLAIISGMTSDDMFYKYIHKNKINHQRKDNGY